MSFTKKKRKEQQQHKNGIGIVYHLLKFSENGGWKVNRIRLSGVVPMENSGRGGKSPAEVVLDGMCVFQLFVQWVTFDTSFSLSRPYFGRWNRFVQMVNAIPGRIYQP